MSREEMINYMAEVEGNRQRVLLLTKPMNDLQVTRMYETMLKQQKNLLMEAAFE